MKNSEIIEIIEIRNQDYIAGVQIYTTLTSHNYHPSFKNKCRHYSDGLICLDPTKHESRFLMKDKITPEEIDTENDFFNSVVVKISEFENVILKPFSGKLDTLDLARFVFSAILEKRSEYVKYIPKSSIFNLYNPLVMLLDSVSINMDNNVLTIGNLVFREPEAQRKISNTTLNMPLQRPLSDEEYDCQFLPDDDIVYEMKARGASIEKINKHKLAQEAKKDAYHKNYAKIQENEKQDRILDHKRKLGLI